MSFSIICFQKVVATTPVSFLEHPSLPAAPNLPKLTFEALHRKGDATCPSSRFYGHLPAATVAALLGEDYERAAPL
jgi:hypothetical protein